MKRSLFLIGLVLSWSVGFAQGDKLDTCALVQKARKYSVNYFLEMQDEEGKFACDLQYDNHRKVWDEGLSYQTNVLLGLSHFASSGSVDEDTINSVRRGVKLIQSKVKQNERKAWLAESVSGKATALPVALL